MDGWMEAWISWRPCEETMVSGIVSGMVSGMVSSETMVSGMVRDSL
jgi:hypothetical protein